MAFNLNRPTGRFIHSFVSKGDLCDPPMVEAITGSLQPGDHVIDIGSHIGYYSLLARQMVGSGGRILGFEANPETFGVFLSSITANHYDNVVAVNCAVSDSEGVLDFTISDGDEGLSSLSRAVSGRRISVFSTTLDRLHRNLGLDRVRLVKIDVEGFESAVIRGGKTFFAQVRPESVIFETNRNIPGMAPHNDLPIRQYFASLGYRSFLIRPFTASPQIDALYGNSQYLEIPPDVALEIGYGNILSTRRTITAPTLPC